MLRDSWSGNTRPRRIWKGCRLPHRAPVRFQHSPKTQPSSHVRVPVGHRSRAAGAMPGLYFAVPRPYSVYRPGFAVARPAAQCAQAQYGPRCAGRSFRPGRPRASFERRPVAAGPGRATHCQWHPGGQAPSPIPDSPFKVSTRLLRLLKLPVVCTRAAMPGPSRWPFSLNGGSFEAVMRRLQGRRCGVCTRVRMPR